VLFRKRFVQVAINIAKKACGWW